MLRSDFLAQSGHGFLLFGLKLLQFSSYFFDLDANFCANQPFLVFRERLLGPWEFSSRILALSDFWQDSFLFPELARIALLFTKNAHHRDNCIHLTGFCGFNHDSIGPHVITSGCIDNFDWTGLSRQIDSTKRLIYFKTLVYAKSRIAVPRFLFTVGTITGVIVTLLALLRLTGFLFGL
jgi:hypothetical protein